MEEERSLENILNQHAFAPMPSCKHPKNKRPCSQFSSKTERSTENIYVSDRVQESHDARKDVLKWYTNSNNITTLMNKFILRKKLKTIDYKLLDWH